MFGVSSSAIFYNKKLHNRVTFRDDGVVVMYAIRPCGVFRITLLLCNYGGWGQN